MSYRCVNGSQFDTDLDGFGDKAEQNILQGLEFLKTSFGRQSIGIIMPIAREIIEKLKNHLHSRKLISLLLLALIKTF